MDAIIKRKLTADELEALPTEVKKQQHPTITRLTQRHHKLARLIAHKLPFNKIALLTGYTPEMVSRLNASPALKNLVSFYTENDKDMLTDMREELLGLSTDAVHEPQTCLLYTSPSPRDRQKSRMPSSA